jgi:hypothetical protein
MKIPISRSTETFPLSVDGLRHSSSANMKPFFIKHVVTRCDGRIYHSCFEECHKLTFVFSSDTEVASKNLYNCLFLN